LEAKKENGRKNSQPFLDSHNESTSALPHRFTSED
jgi:hypothetical protein